ncbi:MAG: hypothetical protein II007_02660 [Gammaproteobacteria bacterium]|nr:hypothetical protein [Gammaproteobacteria bacterium]
MGVLIKVLLFIAIWLGAGVLLIGGGASSAWGWQIDTAIAIAAITLTLALVTAERGLFDSSTIGLAMPLLAALTLWGLFTRPTPQPETTSTLITDTEVVDISMEPAVRTPSPAPPSPSAVRPQRTTDAPKLASSNREQPSSSTALPQLEGTCAMNTDLRRWCRTFYFEQYAGNVAELRQQLASQPMWVPDPWPYDACPTYGKLGNKVQFMAATNMRVDTTECGTAKATGSSRKLLECRQWYTYDCVIPGTRPLPTEHASTN